jgi:hypothetical protein
MRGKKVKELRMDAIIATYGILTKEQRRSVLKDPQFRRIWRAKKKNYTSHKLVTNVS